MIKLSQRDNQTEGMWMKPEGEIFAWREGKSSHVDALIELSMEYRKLYNTISAEVGEASANQTIVDLAKSNGWVRAGLLDDADGSVLYMETNSMNSIIQFLNRDATGLGIDTFKYLTNDGRGKVKVPEGYTGNLGDLI